MSFLCSEEAAYVNGTTCEFLLRTGTNGSLTYHSDGGRRFNHLNEDCFDWYECKYDPLWGFPVRVILV